MRNINHGRGYNFEYWLVKNLSFTNTDEEWRARRLGGSSTGLPDVVAVNNHNGILFSIEAKSIITNWASIPTDEILRCFDIKDMFKLYSNSYVVFAFKFGADRKNKEKVYKLGKGKEGTKKKRTNKDIKHYFFVIKIIQNIGSIEYVRCNYQGELFIKKNTKAELTPGIGYIKFEDINELRNQSKIAFINSKLKYC